MGARENLTEAVREALAVQVAVGDEALVDEVIAAVLEAVSSDEEMLNSFYDLEILAIGHALDRADRFVSDSGSDRWEEMYEKILNQGKTLVKDTLAAVKLSAIPRRVNLNATELDYLPVNTVIVDKNGDVLKRQLTGWVSLNSHRSGIPSDDIVSEGCPVIIMGLAEEE